MSPHRVAGFGGVDADRVLDDDIVGSAFQQSYTFQGTFIATQTLFQGGRIFFRLSPGDARSRRRGIRRG